MIKSVVFLCSIAFVVYFVEALSYSLSLVVWRSKQYSLTSSVFNIIALAARFAQMFQAPLLGILVDVSISTNSDPLGYFRLILIFASAGILFAILCLPTFLNLFMLIIKRVSVKGSIMKGMFEGVELKKLEHLKTYSRVPDKSMMKGIRSITKYKYLLLTNILISSIYSVGVLSAYYAAVQLPNHRLAISGFSGSINGIASMIMILFFDPQIAMITDEVYKGKREYLDLKLIVLLLIFSRLSGTLIGQLIFVPASKWIILIFNILT